jgi:hypothetical protein
MIVRVENDFFQSDRLVSAVKQGGKMIVTLASPGGNVQLGLYLSPSQFEALVRGELNEEVGGSTGHDFSTPAQWANRGRAGSEGSM